MTINILYGKSQKDLMSACFEKIKSKQDQTSRNLLIVPETSKFDFESLFLSHTKEKGMMRSEVLSFSRFCNKILTEIGKQNLEYIDDIGQTMLVYKILNDMTQEFVLYKNLAKKAGFVNQIISVIGEMNRLLVDENMLLKASQSSEDRIFAQKTLELSILIKEYKKRLETLQLNDPSQIYSTVTKIIKEFQNLNENNNISWPYDKIKWLSDTNIWIIGFANQRNFTLQEQDLIKVLSKTSEITITAYCDEKCLEEENDEQINEFFFAGLKTIQNFLKEDQIETKLTHVKEKPEKLIKHLADNFVTGTKNEYMLDNSEKDNICIYYGMSPREEISIVAGKIKELISMSDLRYKDIAIATTNSNMYYPIIRTIFEDASIPLFLDEKKSLQQTALGRLIESLFGIVRFKWSRQSVVSYLRSGFCEVSNETTDVYENFLLENGLQGKQGILDSEIYLEENFLEMKEYRDKVFENVLLFEKEILDSQNAIEYADAFLNFLKRESINQKCESLISQLTLANQEDGAQALAKAWNQVLHLTEQTKKVLGKIKLDFASYRDIMISGIKNSYAGIIPSLIDQVDVFEVGKISYKDIKALFIVGLSEDLYPQKTPGEGLFKDKDREILSNLFDIYIPSILTDRINEENIIMHNLLSLPKEKIYFSCPRIENKQSTLLDFVESNVKNCNKIFFEQLPTPESVQIYSTKKAIDIYCSFLKLQKLEQWQWFVSELEKDLILHKRLNDMLNVKKKSLREIKISKENILKKLQAPVVMSISQIESYRKCAYYYLAKYLLILRQRKERQVKDTEAGIILHGLAQECINDFLSEYSNCENDEKRKKLLEKYASNDFESYVKEKMKKVAKNSRISHIFDEGTYSYKGVRTCKIAASTLRAIFKEIKSDNLIPNQVEWEFTSRNNTHLEVDSQIGKVYLQGLIDRVDTDDEHFRVIDYKSSKRTVNFNEMYHGLSVQLLAYIAAYKSANPQREALEAGYLQFNRPIISFENTSIEEINEKIEKKIDSEQKINSTGLSSADLILASEYGLKMIGDITTELVNGKYNVNPKKIRKCKLPCEYCDYRSLCGFEDSDTPIIYEQLPKQKTDEGKAVKNKYVFIEMIKKSLNEEGE